MKSNKSDKKELVMYLIIFIALLILSICNKLFWKLGANQSNNNNNTYFITDNIIYNVPYEEEWLD